MGASLVLLALSTYTQLYFPRHVEMFTVWCKSQHKYLISEPHIK